MPGGYVDIVFNVGDPVYGSDSGGIFVDKGGSFVVGPLDRFRRFHTDGQFEFLGIRFHPGRVPFFFNLPLGELRNRAIPLATVCEGQDLKQEIEALELSVAQGSSMAHRITRVERLLIRFLRRWKVPDAAVIQALRLIEESKGQIPVEALATALSISGRQLERKFHQDVGLSPKAFSRVIRFRQAKSLLESFSGPTGCDLAYACGYYDQTHFIRDFRLFTGQTPTRYERIQPVGFFLYDCPPNC